MMKQRIKNQLLLLALLTVFIGKIEAQITIGSGHIPAKAALLQIKDTEPAISTLQTNNVTATRGGLVLPRVVLADPMELAPFITGTPSPQQKKDLIGLLVFNLSATIPLKPGLYFWDGEEWNLLILH